MKNHMAYERGELLSRRVTPRNVEARLAGRYDGPIGELNRWVDEVRATTGESIPYFDPCAASREAKVLMLLQDPSSAADGESGFISLHNNDQTAHNIYKLCEETSLSYAEYVPWNVVPWWVANPAKGRRNFKTEASRARPYLEAVVDLLPGDLAAVIVMGKSQTWPAWHAAVGGSHRRFRGAEVLFTAHPGPLSINQTDKDTGHRNRETIAEAFTHAASLIR
ncbi:uracil-DNA glycosylase family protein [Nocardia aurantiaca]|uniref:Uracil-DNA glycosylase n=1 Tax=Nocardia aurantiaca TaxID=2675850 RepID=A0A6I3L9Y4_9NOCA|nr:hypothetical protein [Nocardia aurantiaca]MTE17026.1 hypothetical protein [Nocardia aurantiaca]